MDYLFEFSGRINRAKMWLFILVMIGWNALTFVIVAYGFDWADFFTSFRAQIQASPHEMNWRTLAWPSLESPQATVALAAMFFMFITSTWANFAVMTKRLHDRDKSIWWLLPFVLLPWVLSWLQASAALLQGLNPGILTAMALGGLVGFVINIWAFIELFCLRGTNGTNRFGPDPLSSLRSLIDA